MEQNFANERLRATLNHIISGNNNNDNNGDNSLSLSPCAVPPPPFVQYDESELRWNGWGYGDTEFRLGPEGEVILYGNKYSLSGKVSKYLFTK